MTLIRISPIFLLAMLLTYSSCLQVEQKGPRSHRSINAGWLFHKGDLEHGFDIALDDLGWARVNLPHTWNVEDPFDRRGIDDGYDMAPGYYRGPSWYRKTITVPKSSAGKRLLLVFEGANKVTDVWVNGTYVGNHIGGYSGFRFDITPYVEIGKHNLIAVKVNNAYDYDIPPQSADYTMYGGIYRDVYLLETAQTYIQWAHILTPEVSKELAKVEFSTAIRNASGQPFAGHLEISIYDQDGEQVISSSSKIMVRADSDTSLRVVLSELPHPHLWSPDAPRLYSATARLIREGEAIDALTEKFGLRWFDFDPQKGFFLNGEHLRLKGVNRHQDRAHYGNAVPDELHIRDMQLIKSLGANFVRLAHYQQDPSVLEACDSIGLLVWEEIPVVRSVGRDKFKAHAKQMLKELITQHINHPSIIIWGVMNEVIRDQPDNELHWSVDLSRELVELAKSLDPSRFTAQAQYKDRGTDIMGTTEISGWNCYYGWYHSEFADFGRVMDERRELYPDQVFIISEYGAGSKIGYHIEKPTAPDFSEEWQMAFHRSYWKQISERPYIAGSLVWNMFDFGSYEKGGNIPHINQKGLADFDRAPKDVYYYYQSIWSEEPMIYIVSHTWLERSGTAGEAKVVEVLSNCDTVELFLNGESLGIRRYPFSWQVGFVSGANRLQATGTHGNTTVDDRITIQFSIKGQTLEAGVE